MNTEKTHKAKLVHMYPQSIDPFKILKNLLLDLEDIERKITDQFKQEVNA